MTTRPQLPTPDTDFRKGLGSLILAYAIWGLFPLYWRLLSDIAPLDQLAVRLILTAGFCLLLLPIRGSFRAFVQAWRSVATLRTCLITAILLAANWLAFIWTIVNGRVMESSLGYFLCPLVSVLLGRILGGERLRRQQQLAVALAALAVTFLLFKSTDLPIAAIIIALTWGGYGWFKKRSALGPVVSLCLECSLLSPLALLFLAFSSTSLAAAPASSLGILGLAGMITAAPLILFSFGAQRVPLSTLGMGQYLVPTAHLLLALLFGEPLDLSRLLAFVLVWIALALYASSRPAR